MTFTHPRTARLVDPGLPAVSALLGTQPPKPLRAVVDAAGGRLLTAGATNVTWWPGTSIAVTYDAEVEGGPMAGPHRMVAVAGDVPDGAAVAAADDQEVGVWRIPHDPALPGMAEALDPGRAGEVVASLGGEGSGVRTRLRAYRPGRRAVVSVEGPAHGLFFKLTRPSRIESLHRRHRELPDSLPVPRSLGVDAELGILALQALPGRTLRRALDDSAAALPAPEDVVGLASGLPAPTGDATAPSPIERVPRLAELLIAIVPEQAGRIEEIIHSIGPDDVTDRVPAHGDFYEAQVLVDAGRIVGMLDVDTYGWGRPADDAATMLGHLAVWATLSTQPQRVNEYAAALLRRWDALVDPSDLRRRVAAVIVTLATGPFRVQRLDWPEETSNRLRLAERWIESARRVDERDLIAGSG